MHGWHLLSSPAAVHLPMTLCGGQCFRWRQTARGSWVGVVKRSAYELACGATPPPGADAVHQHGTQHTASSISSSPLPTHDNFVEDTLWFRCLSRELNSEADVSVETRFLRHYLALDIDLQQLWQRWTVDNPMGEHPLVRYLTSHLTKEAHPVSIRHLRQDIHEVLLAFLCSQNNNVQRITSLMEKIATTYGFYLCDYNLATGEVRRGEKCSKPVAKHAKKNLKGADEWVALHRLPTIDQLSKQSEDDLRALGLGYRSKYIFDCASIIKASGVTRPAKEKVDGLAPDTKLYKWYEDLLDHRLTLCEQRQKLLALPGVGRKVADCVLLFALGHYEVVPVDTHMAQVAAKYLVETPPAAGAATAPHRAEKKGDRKRVRDAKYSSKVTSVIPESSCEAILADWSKKEKSDDKKKVAALLPKHHDAIQRQFQCLFGDHCGWAHSILFYERMRKGKTSA
ncbi:8-oxoguanine DNA glycosylase [Trypanosoma grayi]|uniref:8-oxoguanine DNA glycosylase n=1 Tax=Trypanosoma grayi TaxID=71804 RepID=UPI0004F48DB2|nr:8-oxoguanine DNA glycosylase [Trypanosoma grayi]KEG09135.1 8-oxoguanine DNA glycosylase [Trypanosoma grayi]